MSVFQFSLTPIVIGWPEVVVIAAMIIALYSLCYYNG
jgi:hypothetical protein